MKENSLSCLHFGVVLTIISINVYKVCDGHMVTVYWRASWYCFGLYLNFVTNASLCFVLISKGIC